MSDPPIVGPDVEIADLLRRMPGLLRGAASIVALDEQTSAAEVVRIAGGFDCDHALVAASISLIGRFAGYAGFDAKDLEALAVKIDKTSRRQPWRRS